jgi:diguanylate cyclase (GGDEF)-like protein
LVPAEVSALLMALRAARSRASAARLDPRSGLVLAMTAAMAVLAVLVYCRGLDPSLSSPTPVLPWWAFAVSFFATEACLRYVQVQREGQSITIGELPLVLGLFFAGPLQLLVGRLVGMALVFYFYRRASLLKTSWNLSFAALHTALAAWIFQLVAGAHGVMSPWGWLGAFAGPLVANAFSAVALTAVVGIYEGGMNVRQMLRDMVASEPAVPIVVTFALVAGITVSAYPLSAWLVLLLGVGVLVGYRVYAGLANRHLSLERLYRFTQAVTSSPEVDHVLGSVLAEARELLHCERAAVSFVASVEGDVAEVALGASGRLTHTEGLSRSEDSWLLSRVVSQGTPVLLHRATKDVEERRWLTDHGARDAIAVPLRGSAGVLGALVVTDRLGDVRSFDESDVQLLETVANHGSVALQNGQLVNKLRHEAMHDALTGLPNRAYLQRRLVAALDDVADGRSRGTAAMILDLDGFKEINDTLGHQHGDLLLIEVAERLRTAVGASGLVTRLGGDEFAVLVVGTDDEDRLVRVGHRILRALEQPVALDGIEVEIGGSLGIAIAPRHAEDPSALLKCADVAMYDAKDSTRGLRVFEPQLDTGDPWRLTLVSELRAALNADAIQVHMQPQARTSTGETVCVEALVRWVHPEHGNIPPDEFIPVAERSGLIGPLTTRVLDASLAAVAGWHAQGHQIGVSVNLSTRSLHDADIVEEVGRLLRRHRVPPALLTLEITEGSFMADPVRAIALLHQLRELGVRLSVDDFGTGYSSLSYLTRLPVHEVKIDRSFVIGLRDDTDDAAIVRAIVDLGRHLGLQVVAEGVEDQVTWDLLAEMGCDLVQGWHLSRPMPAADLLPWLRARSGAGKGRALRAI